MNHVIAKSLPIVGRAIADKAGMRFYIQGEQAYTNYDSIVIPYGDFNDPAYVTKALGFTVHEGGHNRFTIPEAKQKLNNAVAKAFYMAIEDVRMEREVIDEYPGAHTMLHDLVKLVIQDGHFPVIVDDIDMPTEKQLSFYVLYRLRNEVLNQSGLDETAKCSEETIRRKFPKGLVTRLNALMYQVTSARDTNDVVDICNKIATMIEEEAREQQERNQSQQNQQDDQQPQSGDDTDTEASGGGSDDQADSDPSDDSQGSDTTDQDGDADNQGANDQTDGTEDSDTSDGADDVQPTDADGSSDGDQDDTNDSSNEDGGDGHGNGEIDLQEMIDDGDWDDAGTDLGDVIKDMIDSDDTVQEAAGTNRYGFPSMGEEVDPPSSKGDATDLILKCQSASNALATRMQNLVEASSLAEIREDIEGELDPNLIWKAAIGDPELFSDEDEIIEVNTGIQILFDRSGSMRDEIKIAREAALATGLALERIEGTQVGVAAFPAYGGHVQPLTRLEESVRQTANRYNIGVTGSTPMAEAMLWAIKELAYMEVDRRMLMVITDGDPDNDEGVKELVQMCERYGIQTMGIGIHSHSVRRLFPSYCVIKNVDELATAMFSMVEPLVKFEKAA
jgi:cobalamin biosynthesis protein CobT